MVKYFPFGPSLLRIFISISLYAFPTPSVAHDRRSLGIAVIVPLSGPLASAGESFKNGIELGLTKLSIGQRALLNFTFDDDQGTPRNTISSFRKMMQTARPDMVVTVTAGTGMGLAPVAESSGVPHLAAVSRATLTCAGRKNCFLFWPTPEQVVSKTLGDLASRTMTHIAMISAIHDGSLTMVREFKAQRRHEIFVLQDEYPPDSQDFRPFLLKVKQHPEIEVIINNLIHGQIGTFERQAHEMRVTVPRMGLEVHGAEPEWKIAGGAMKGERYYGVSFENPALEQEYRNRFPGASAYAASFGYDLVSLLVHATEINQSDLGVYFTNLKDFRGAGGMISKDERNRLTVAPSLHVVP